MDLPKHIFFYYSSVPPRALVAAQAAVEESGASGSRKDSRFLLWRASAAYEKITGAILDQGRFLNWKKSKSRKEKQLLQHLQTRPFGPAVKMTLGLNSWHRF